MYMREVKCNHHFKEVKDTIERCEDERSLGLVVYEYNRKRIMCSECGYVKSENVAFTPNR